MTRIILSFLLICFATSVYSEVGTTTLTVNLVSHERTNLETVISYEFPDTAPFGTYTITLEVSFDNGSTFEPIPMEDLSGDLTKVRPGGEVYSITWDGAKSFANKSSTQTIVRITAVSGSPYDLTLETDPAMGGTASDETGEDSYEENVKVDIKAEPNPGWGFVYWTGDYADYLDDATDAETSLTMPASNVTLTANFEEDPDVTITYEATTGGTVSPVSETLAPATGAAQGSTATPDPGYSFINWTDDGNEEVSTNLQFIPETDNDGLNFEATYTANFEEDDDVTITYEVTSGGSVSPGSETLAPATGAAQGSTATPDPGYSFVNWTDGEGAEVGDQEAFIPETDDHGLNFEATYTANFELIDYTLTLNADPGTAGSVEDITNEAPYNIGNQVYIRAEGSANWGFIEWLGDTQYLDDANKAEATLTMPADNVVLTAKFQKYPIYGGGVTDIDGNEYETVIIGRQEWMAENLRVTRHNNIHAIFTGLTDDQWSSWTSSPDRDQGAYAVYDHDHHTADGIESPDEMIEAYGLLYNWYAVDYYGGLCPEGWRVPSDDDWMQLVNYVAGKGHSNDWEDPDGAGNAFKSPLQYKETTDDPLDHPRWDSDDTHHGFNKFGFSALPGGYRHANGSYNFIGGYGYWHTTTVHPHDSDDYYRRRISHDNGTVWRSYDNKLFGLSVRCIKD